jgi:hemoglobin
MNSRPSTIYEQIGGFEAFRRLVDAFYAEVERDPLLRPLYPESLDGPREHLALFLSQYFGGPATYSERRGHPRLRMRHFPFAIGRPERDAWVAHMLDAVDSTAIPEPARSEMRDYFQNAATFLINRESPPAEDADRVL